MTMLLYRLRIAVIFSIAALTVSTFAAAQAPHNPPPNARHTALQEALSWLPEDTETVIGANGPFLFPDFDRLRQQAVPQTNLTTAELGLRMQLTALTLLGLKNGDLPASLRGKSVALVLEGSRRFRSPAALGLMRYEGCEIVEFGPAVTLDRDSFLKNAAKSAVRMESLEGLQIAVFEERMENDLWTTFVAFPRKNVVLVATDVDYLRTLLARMGRSSGPRALPENLPEWKYVNPQSPLWGVRHYKKGDEAVDPTSPSAEQAPANIPDSSAVGITFWMEAASARKVHFVYFSSAKNPRRPLENAFGISDADADSHPEFPIRWRQPEPGAVEGSVPVGSAEAFYTLQALLLGMLGHATYF